MSNSVFLQLAIDKAVESVSMGGFPAGAIIVSKGRIIGSGISIGNKINDPTSHGEMMAIRDACKNVGQTDLTGAVLYSSMQPCLMCLGAAQWSSISKIVFACPKSKVSNEYYGGNYVPEEINKNLNRPIEFIYVPEMESISLKVISDWEASLK